MPQKKEKAPNILRHRSKRNLTKKPSGRCGVRTVKGEASSRSCMPLCRRAKICLYLRHRAFRSEQSRHRWKDYYRSFALTKNSKYVKMRPPGKAGRPSEWNNTANAGRIVSKPKRQEDSSCVFACRFCRGTCHRRGTTGKRKCAEIASAQVRKKKFYKKSSGRCGVRTVKGEASSRPLYAAVRVRHRIYGVSYILRSVAGRITGHRRSLPQPSSAAWCPRLLTRAEVKDLHTAAY